MFTITSAELQSLELLKSFRPLRSVCVSLCLDAGRGDCRLEPFMVAVQVGNLASRKMAKTECSINTLWSKMATTVSFWFTLAICCIVWWNKLHPRRQYFRWGNGGDDWDYRTFHFESSKRAVSVVCKTWDEEHWKKTPARSWTLVRFSLLQPKTFADLLYSLPFVDSYLNKNAL